MVTNSVGRKEGGRAEWKWKEAKAAYRTNETFLPNSACRDKRERTDGRARERSRGSSNRGRTGRMDGRTDGRTDGRRVWRDLNESNTGFFSSFSARYHSLASHSLQPLSLGSLLSSGMQPVSPPLASDRWATRHPSGKKREKGAFGRSVVGSVTAW